MNNELPKGNPRRSSKSDFYATLIVEVAKAQRASTVKVGEVSIPISTLMTDGNIVPFAGVVLEVKNINPTCEEGKTRPTLAIGFRASAYCKDNPSITLTSRRSFSARKFGYAEAYNKAVQYRAESFGVEERLPFLMPPSISSLATYLTEKYGAQWVSEHRETIVSIISDKGGE